MAAPAASAAAKNATKGLAKGAAAAASRPVSSLFDASKPHWTLRWVAEDAASDCVDVRKDTERAEEIRALKRAWEAVEVGRAAKAMLARQSFLKANLVRACASLY